MQYDLIIGIDPAGIGNNGMVIYSSETNNITFNETFKTKTVLESKNIYKEYFKLIKKQFINQKNISYCRKFLFKLKTIIN
ncbi:hypothetical protein [Spiroplasma endosymbiont of Tricholauxania praeusta]|uniref:hypothetical protein n=1 Tax=Spiroplasma endosymbiont of Tricholauxania praeusta TaxID=3066296 RepID=UPI0030CE030D